MDFPEPKEKPVNPYSILYEFALLPEEKLRVIFEG